MFSCVARIGSDKGRPDAAGGFALVVVIVILLLVSFLASELILQVKTELRVTQNIKSRTVGAFLAEAGVNLGIFRLVDRPAAPPAIGNPEDYEEFFEGYEYAVDLPAGRVSYFVASETGKIDLNKSPMPLIEMFVAYHLGGDAAKEEVATVLDSLLNWRDNDDLHRLSGAESEAYSALDEPYIARNGNIEDPSEFFLIKGTDKLLGKFHADEVFTVHNGTGKINFNSLTPAMLDFVTLGNAEAKEAYRAAKEEFHGVLNQALAMEIMGEMRYLELQPYLVFATGNSVYYSVVGTGEAGGEPEGGATPPVHAGGHERKRPGTRVSVMIRKDAAGFVRLIRRERYS